MVETVQEMKVVLKRPIDITSNIMSAVRDLMVLNPTVTEAQKRQEFSGTEVFFLCGTTERYLGMLALRYANAATHREIFTRAGVTDMYNPYSIESRWLFVHPDAAGQGVDKRLKQMRNQYLADRPCHEIILANRASTTTNMGFSPAGRTFSMTDSGDKMQLRLYGHDPVFDPDKRLVYC